MRFDYDVKDVEILRLLGRNGKLSYRKIAKQLGMHPNTAMARIKRMENEKVIERYTIAVDYKKIDYKINAMLQLDIKGRVRDAAEKMALIPDMRQIYHTTGDYDMVAITMCHDMEELNTMINRVASFPFVRRSNVKVILEAFNQNPQI